MDNTDQLLFGFLQLFMFEKVYFTFQMFITPL